MTNKEQFYQELNLDTYCGYTWCRKLYGYSKFEPKFLEQIGKKLDELGRSRVKYVFSVYFKTQMAYELGQEKAAGEWYSKQQEKKQEREVQKNSSRRNIQFNGLPQDW